MRGTTADLSDARAQTDEECWNIGRAVSFAEPEQARGEMSICVCARTPHLDRPIVEQRHEVISRIGSDRLGDVGIERVDGRGRARLDARFRASGAVAVHLVVLGDGTTPGLDSAIPEQSKRGVVADANLTASLPSPGTAAGSVRPTSLGVTPVSPGR